MIEAQGYTGAVKEIQIFDTILTTPDNKTVLIPNGPLATCTSITYATQHTGRVNWAIGIAYGDDPDKAYEVINKLIAADDKILKDPEPFVALSALADRAVNIVVRAWVYARDYWSGFFKINVGLSCSFGKESLSISFPLIDVHVRKAD